MVRQAHHDKWEHHDNWGHHDTPLVTLINNIVILSWSKGELTACPEFIEGQSAEPAPSWFDKLTMTNLLSS
jgi:hypothetical protein